MRDSVPALPTHNAQQLRKTARFKKGGIPRYACKDCKEVMPYGTMGPDCYCEPCQEPCNTRAAARKLEEARRKDAMGVGKSVCAEYGPCYKCQAPTGIDSVCILDVREETERVFCSYDCMMERVRLAQRMLDEADVE